MSETTGTETAVVYFPPDSSRQTRKAKDLDDARRICAELAEYAPLIQQRTVTYSPWVIVENPAVTGDEA